MAELHYTRRARRDLLDIWSYIAEHNRVAADQVYRRLGARIKGVQIVRVLHGARHIAPALFGREI